MGSFDHRLDLWEEGEVAGSQVWRIGWVFKHNDVVISEKLLHRQSVVGWGIVLVQNPTVSSQFWSFLSHAFVQFRQDFKIILLIYRLAAGNPLRHYSTLDIEENNNMALNFERLMLVLVLEMLLASSALIVAWFYSKPQSTTGKFPWRISSLSDNSLSTLALQHFPTECKKTSTFEYASTRTE
jgi:hypothetical protein